MERELLMSGIGGQGVQLAAQVISRAALAEGRHVQLFGSYGGMMRGGNTEATVVIADAPVESPPTVASAWSGIVMHHDYSETVIRRITPGGVLLVNATVFAGPLPCDREAVRVLEVPATDVAVEVGNIMTASMVITGAYAAATGLVTLESLAAGVASALPSYRSQHVALNVAALEAGYALVPHGVVAAWPVTRAGAP